MKTMKTIYATLSVGVVMFTLWSCSGNNDASQQQVTVPTAQEQPVQAAPADSTAVQPQTTAPAAAAQSLPETITAFVKQHFPNATIAGIEPDNDHGGVEYDVYLSDGTELDFDVNNQWETVECRASGVPAAFIPQAIANYVKSNYQNMTIAKIHKEYHGYEIELSNGLELNFDKSGNFMGMDD